MILPLSLLSPSVNLSPVTQSRCTTWMGQEEGIQRINVRNSAKSAGGFPYIFRTRSYGHI